MANKTTMRARLREELHDEDAAGYTWSDAQLNDLIVEANDWYSRLFPLKSTGYRDVAQDQRIFVLPTGMYDVDQVECPPGRLLPNDTFGPVGSPTSTGPRQRQGWYKRGVKIYLYNPAAGDEVGAANLLMSGSFPHSRPDPTDPWDGPDEDVRLLVLWSAIQALRQLDVAGNKLGRTEIAPLIANYKAALDFELSLRYRRARGRTLRSDQ